MNPEALRAMTAERDALATELAAEKDYALSGWTLANNHLARVKALEAKVAKARELLEKCGYRGWAKAKNAWLDDSPAKPPVQVQCLCGTSHCLKNQLKSHEYCGRDRTAAGLAQETGGVKA